MEFTFFMNAYAVGSTLSFYTQTLILDAFAVFTLSSFLICPKFPNFLLDVKLENLTSADRGLVFISDSRDHSTKSKLREAYYKAWQDCSKYCEDEWRSWRLLLPLRIHQSEAGYWIHTVDLEYARVHMPTYDRHYAHTSTGTVIHPSSYEATCLSASVTASVDLCAVVGRSVTVRSVAVNTPTSAIRTFRDSSVYVARFKRRQLRVQPRMTDRLIAIARSFLAHLVARA